MKTPDPALLAQIPEDIEAIKKSVAKTIGTKEQTIIALPNISNTCPHFAQGTKLLIIRMGATEYLDKRIPALPLPIKQDAEFAFEQLSNFIRIHSVKSLITQAPNLCNANDFTIYERLYAVSKKLNGTDKSLITQAPNLCNTNDFAIYERLYAVSKQLNGTEKIWRTRHGRALLARRKQLRAMIKTAQR